MDPLQQHNALSLLSPSVDALLQRDVPSEYLADWQQAILLDEKHAEEENYHPFVVFRLHDEYFAITASVIGEITLLRAVHRLPHVSIPFIEGLVNVNGRLRIFISMEKLLQLPREPNLSWKIGGVLVLIEKVGSGWTFMVTELLGVPHVTPEMIQPLAVTASKSTAHYMKGVFTWKGHTIAILDEEILALRLHHSL